MNQLQKKVLFATLILVSIVGVLSGQELAQNLVDTVLESEDNRIPSEQEITASGLYRWGEGTGETLEKAKERSRHDLATKIQAFIQSTQTRIYAEEGDRTADQFVISSKIFSVLKINNLEYLVLEAPEISKYRTIAYITNSDFNILVQNQKDKIRQFVQQAELSLDEYNIGDCLKNYYWAYLLTHTLTDTLQLEFEGNKWNNPQVALLSRLHTIIERLQITITSIDEGVGYIGANLAATYLGGAVNNLNFSYYSGIGNDYGSFQNGRGYVEKYSNDSIDEFNRVKLQIEYAGESGMRHHGDLLALYEIYKTTPLENAWKTVYLEENTSSIPEEVEVVSSNTIKTYPRPVHILSAAGNLEEFLFSLQSYSRAQRIVLYGDSSEIPQGTRNIYVAVVSNEELVGIYHKSENGYANISTGEVISFSGGEFTGARQIWMVIND